MLHGHDTNGIASIDEAMSMLCARMDREQIKTIITKLCGGEDGAWIKEVGYQGEI